MRHHNWFARQVRGECAAGGTTTAFAKHVNHYLQLGFGTGAEVKCGAASRTIPSVCDVCGADNKVSATLKDFLNGANPVLADVYLQPGGALSVARAQALREIHKKNIGKRKEQKAIVNAGKKAAKEASGRSKKRKPEAADEGTSSDP